MKTLVIVWNDGTTETHVYNTYEDAKQAETGYKMAFGNQIQWSGIRDR